MDELIKLVRKYRLTESLDGRLKLVEKILEHIEPSLRSSVFGSIEQPAAKDVLQEVLIAIWESIDTFKGDSHGQIWGWCYGILNHKRCNYFKKQANERFQSLPPDELLEYLDLSGDSEPLKAGDRLDLEYAWNLLTKSKPECGDYLWKRFAFGYTLREIAKERKLRYDAARMNVNRCLDKVRSLLS